MPNVDSSEITHSVSTSRNCEAGCVSGLWIVTMEDVVRPLVSPQRSEMTSVKIRVKFKSVVSPTGRILPPPQTYVTHIYTVK